MGANQDNDGYNDNYPVIGKWECSLAAGLTYFSGVNQCSRPREAFLDVARPPSRDPPPGDRLPGGLEIFLDVARSRSDARPDF
eukprot:1188951-Prorocentrum_minimum.AAC.2